MGNKIEKIKCAVSKAKPICAFIGDFVKQTSRTRLAITAWRILMVYIALQICRAIFYIYNSDLIGSIGGGEFWTLFKGSILFDNASIVYTALPFLLLSMLPFPAKIWNSKGYRNTMFWLYIIPVSIILAINLGDVVYFHYTQMRCTAEDIMFAENGNTVALMFSFMLENWYLIFVFIALVTALVYGYRRKFVAEDIFKVPARKEGVAGRKAWLNGSFLGGLSLVVVAKALVIIIITVYSIFSIRGSLTNSRPITLSNSMHYTMEPNKGLLILSNPFCIIRTLSQHIDVPTYFDEEEIENIYTPSHYPDTFEKSEMFGLCKDYNVVLFILESFSAEHSAFLMPEAHDNGGYTPNLDKLMAEGLVFNRCYANGLKSIAAPPSIWASIPSYEYLFVLLAESVSDCRPMPRILAESGYHTSFFCGSEEGSMGFGAYAHTVGIEHLYAQEDFEANRSGDHYDGAWGIYDEPFIDYMGEELSGFPQPFFSSIFTITSHHPFNIPESAKEGLPKGTTDNHRPIAYVDRGIGRFMEKYKDEPWFNNTLFVFVADHVSSERMLERTLHEPGYFHIMGFMYTPDGKLREALSDEHKDGYNHIVSQVDIMPTILGLMGNEEPYFAIGRDIFNEPDREPFALVYSGFNYLGLTDEHVVKFSRNTDSHIGVFDYDDIYQEHDLSNDVNVEHTDTLIKATMQQYYNHVSQRDFFAKEREALPEEL